MDIHPNVNNPSGTASQPWADEGDAHPMAMVAISHKQGALPVVERQVVDLSDEEDVDPDRYRRQEPQPFGRDAKLLAISESSGTNDQQIDGEQQCEPTQWGTLIPLAGDEKQQASAGEHGADRHQNPDDLVGPLRLIVGSERRAKAFSQI